MLDSNTFEYDRVVLVPCNNFIMSDFVRVYACSGMNRWCYRVDEVKQPARWEPQEEGVMNIAARFSLN
jgi:hypothetical protein